MERTSISGKRYESLDAARGVGVLLMLAVVWLPGAIQHLQVNTTLGQQLLGSVWHGIRAADLLMSLFLFCCGATAAAVVERRGATASSSVLAQTCQRAGILFLLGLLTCNLALMATGRPAFTLTGPLQQIAVAVLVTHVVVLYLPRGAALMALVYVTANYAFLLASHSADSNPGANTDLLAAYGFQSNLAAWVDSSFLPGNKSFGNWDRFGIVPTAIGTTLALCGASYQQLALAIDVPQRTARLKTALLLGIVVAVAAWSCSAFVPINHYLWTPSFFGMSAGLLIVLVSCLQLIVDHPRCSDLFLLRALGRNSLLFFFICYLANEVPLTLWNVGVAEWMPAGWQSVGLMVAVAAEVLILIAAGCWLATGMRFLTVNRLLGNVSAGS